MAEFVKAQFARPGGRVAIAKLQSQALGRVLQITRSSLPLFKGPAFELGSDIGSDPVGVGDKHQTVRVIVRLVTGIERRGPSTRTVLSL